MRQFAIISIVFSAGLLVAAAYLVDPGRLSAAWQSITVTHLVAALAAVQIQIIASAYRWRFTAGRLGHSIDILVAIREYYLSSALNLLLPGGMAGDAVRAYRGRTPQTGGWKRPAAAVLLERLSGQFAFFALCCLGLLAWPTLMQSRVPDDYRMLVWVVFGSLIGLTVLGIAFRNAWLPQRLQSLGPELHAVFIGSGAWLIQTILSAVIIGGYIVTFPIASDAVGAPLPAIAAVTIIPLCLLTMLIPAGVGGWGTREAAAAALWPVFGYSSAEGLAASLLYGSLSLIGAAVPGLIAMAFAFFRRPADTS